MSALRDCHSPNYSDFPDSSLRRQTCIIHRVINLCNLPTAVSRMPPLAEPSPQKYVGLHFLEVSGFSPEGSAGRPAMMMRMTTTICYIIQWQGVGVGWGVLSGAVPSRIMPERQLCHDNCSFRRSSNRREESSFFSEFFFDLCGHQSGESAAFEAQSVITVFIFYLHGVQFVGFSTI